MEEYFDICTINKKPTGKIGVRGKKLESGEYHIVVMAIILNSNNEVLITKRSKNKIAGGKWECTSGSAILGESSKDAVIREIKEEIGVNTFKMREEPISCFVLDDAIWDIWFITTDIEITDLKLQYEEVEEAKYANLKELDKIIQSGTATKTIEKIIQLHNSGLIKIAN